MLGELVSYIEQVRTDSEHIPVFKLSDLGKLYETRLAQLSNDTNSAVHSTRLTERLLKQIPDLRAQSQGREILLMFDKNIGDAIKLACSQSEDSDAIHLVRASHIIRREIFANKYAFTGAFNDGFEEDIVPHTLKALVSMILEGPTIEDQSHRNTAKLKAVLL